MLALATINAAELPNDCVLLKDLLTSLHAQYSAAIQALHEQVLKLRHAQFGSSSERCVAQAELFGEVLDLPVPPAEKQRVSYERQRRGRAALPKDLPRQRIVYELSESERAQFDRVARIDEEVSETLQYTPAKIGCTGPRTHQVRLHQRRHEHGAYRLRAAITPAEEQCRRLFAGPNSGIHLRRPFARESAVCHLQAPWPGFAPLHPVRVEDRQCRVAAGAARAPYRAHACSASTAQR